MTTLTLRGDQIGQALQFDGKANTTTVEIGQIWLAPNDTVTIAFTPASFDPVTGQRISRAGDDTVPGGACNDLVWGGAGNDQLFGGADVCVFAAGDRVPDFDRNEGEQIHFAASLGLTEADLVITATAQGTVIGAVGVAGTVLLQGCFGRIDVGPDIKFDHVPSFDFL